MPPAGGLPGRSSPGELPDLRRVRIVDVVAGRTVGPVALRIEGARIAAIEPLAAPSDAGPDGGGASTPVVLPGLVDVHVHLVLGAGDDPIGTYRALGADARRETAFAAARRAVEAGITTVRDLGGPPSILLEVAAAIATGLAAGPDVVAAGAPVTRPGGHLALFGGDVQGPDEARRLVARQLADGARAVKLVMSGGGLTPGTRPDRAELPLPVAIAATEAARAGRTPVAAHAHASAAIARALDAGVASIEHVSFVAADGRVVVEPDLVARLRDAGVVAVPTLAAALRTAARYRVAGAHNPAEPDAIARLESRREVVAALLAAGVTLATGSDAGVTDTPHDALLDELDALVAAGLSPAAALRAATVDAARLLGLADRGTIVAGSRADLVVLSADPLDGLATLRRPLAILAGGRSIRPAWRSSTRP